MTSIGPLGDRGFLARFDSEARAALWAESLKRAAWPGVLDIVPAYHTVGVFADPDQIDLDELAGRLAAREADDGPETVGRRIEIPVLYNGEDLPEVAQRLGLTVADVIAAHTSMDFQVFAIGFLPGFPYAGYLPEALRGLPRREAPRTRVPPGSVAIVGRQTAIYPSPCPGGWHLIGQTPLSIVDMSRDYFPIAAGDRLRFVAIREDEFQARREDLL